MFARISFAKSRSKRISSNLHEIIFQFLRGLLISLDFVIAAYISKTIFDRSIEELIIPGIVVTTRILLSWSLSKDFEFYDKKEVRTPRTTAALVLCKSRWIYCCR